MSDKKNYHVWFASWRLAQCGAMRLECSQQFSASESKISFPLGSWILSWYWQRCHNQVWTLPPNASIFNGSEMQSGLHSSGCKTTQVNFKISKLFKTTPFISPKYSMGSIELVGGRYFWSFHPTGTTQPSVLTSRDSEVKYGALGSCSFHFRHIFFFLLQRHC